MKGYTHPWGVMGESPIWAYTDSQKAPLCWRPTGVHTICEPSRRARPRVSALQARSDHTFVIRAGPETTEAGREVAAPSHPAHTQGAQDPTQS